MPKVTASCAKSSFTLSAYAGDGKTLLAFNLASPEDRANLAGFSIHVRLPDGSGYFLINNLQFVNPADHAQMPEEMPNSTVNAPIRKFRWVHVPGLDHQGAQPAHGDYTYTVTPRYFDGDGHMVALDATLAANVTIRVGPFVQGKTQVAFTRGYVQSQAYVHRYGQQIPMRPKGGPLIYDTAQVGGTGPDGQTFTFVEQYAWLGFNARTCVFDVLDAVVADADLSLDVFAYDLNEPDVIARLLTLAGQGRVRVILDDARLHHNAQGTLPEDQFQAAFTAAATGNAAIQRGHFARYAHDKVFIVSHAGRPVKLLTGSTNYSVTGLYVNSNHVLVFDDPSVAAQYAQVFTEAWNDRANATAFAASPLAAGPIAFPGTAAIPAFNVSFSPHKQAVANARLDEIVQRCKAETARPDHKGSIFFAVMELDGGGTNPVYAALNQIHSNPDVFSYGISDSPAGLALYSAGATGGLLTSGKPGKSLLPHPFDQVPTVGLGHQIHHKFVVCGFGTPDAVTFCGSSNLALGGEMDNGDNLLAMQDDNIATAFVIEALLLVDHFNFLDHMAVKKGTGSVAVPDAIDARPRTTVTPVANKRDAAIGAGWFLDTDDHWVAKYFDPNDLRCHDRELFA